VKIGENNWVESIADNEKVNVIVRNVDMTKNGHYYLQGNLAKSAKFFMINVGEKHAVQLEDAKYAVMTCTGHSPKGYPFLEFEVVNDFDMDALYSEDSSQMLTSELESGGGYSFDELESDLLAVLHKINSRSVEDFGKDYNWMKEVKAEVIEALLVIHRRNLVTKGE